MLRLLTPEDFGAAARIGFLKTKHSGTSASTTEMWKLLDLLKQDNLKTKFIGYFDDDQYTLVSWMAIRHGELDGERVWVILGLFTSVFRNHFSWSHPELGRLVEWAFKYCESRGICTYLYTVATRLERVYEHQWKKNPWLPPRDRYTKEVVARVPPGHLHNLNWVNRMAALPKPDGVSVLRRSLKQEYR